MEIFNNLSPNAHEKILACQIEDSDPIKTAKRYSVALKEPGITQKLLSQAIGKKRSYIANAVRLLHLPSDVQQLVSSGRLSFSQARLLLQAIPEMQSRLAHECIRRKWTVRELIEELKIVKPTTDEIKATGQRLYQEKGLVSQIQTNDRGHYFIRFAFSDSQEARLFLKKIEGLKY